MIDFIFFCFSDPVRKLWRFEFIVLHYAAVVNVCGNNFVVGQHDEKFECVISYWVDCTEVWVSNFSLQSNLIKGDACE
ncbi:hypothetical protein D3C87_1132760 [compost metagenome]